jgi:undecaprenyl phosphate N,N'-diacetylbacillosamine 1-phosphate transferase
MQTKIFSNSWAKRVIDLIVAAFALLVMAPLWLVIAAMIKIDSEGPVFFQQERHGLNRKIFKIYKFRTMVEDAQNSGTGLFSYTNDPRITRIGHRLRHWSIDETPQLINVIRGEMSIVGPRPPVVGELEVEKDLPSEYLNRFSVLPGITGLAQTSGRNSLIWSDKIRLDLCYIEQKENSGVLLDLKIMLKTILIVVSRKNVIETEIRDD